MNDSFLLDAFESVGLPVPFTVEEFCKVYGKPVIDMGQPRWELSHAYGMMSLANLLLVAYERGFVLE